MGPLPPPLTPSPPSAILFKKKPGSRLKNLYKTAKSFHLAGLILWLGPSTGGYILLLLANHSGNPEIISWIYKEYINLIYIETLGLVILLTTGFTMRHTAPELKKAGWLKRKLLIVFLLFIPFELAQLYIYLSVVLPAIERGELQNAIRIFGRFSLISAITLALTIPTVFYLAVLRPEYQKNKH